MKGGLKLGFLMHRFQVNKRVEAALKKGHPWVFRRQCSSALEALPLGSLVRLVGTENQFLGWGIYEPLSLVAIRVFSSHEATPDENFFHRQLLKAYAKRQPHLSTAKTDAFRWVHGEADRFPGLTVDVYGKTAVAVFYLQSWKEILAGGLERAAKEIGIKELIAKEPHGQQVPLPSGIHQVTALPTTGPIWFQEMGLTYPCFPHSGLKTGFFLDLREVRKKLLTMDLTGKRVLNLFANDGVFSALALRQGAQEVVSVERKEDGGQNAQILFEKWGLPFNHELWLKQDIWDYLKSKTFADEKPFDLILIDPPSLAHRQSQFATMEKAWKFLHQQALTKAKPGAQLVSISCTERMTLKLHQEWIAQAAKSAGKSLKLLESLPPNFDHPVLPALKERDYFHATVWKVS